tara:strand:+ start:220 stop:429 length:210 start_codon:yes stop_codon:yes gene_type:complete
VTLFGGELKRFHGLEHHEDIAQGDREDKNEKESHRRDATLRFRQYKENPAAKRALHQSASVATLRAVAE